MRWTGLLAAAALVLVSDVFVLIGVARNRSGEPLERIELTERELSRESTSKDNTAVELRLNWRNLGYRIDELSLDDARLDALGVPKGRRRLMFSPEVFVAIANGGDAWEHWREAQEANAPKALDFSEYSRLVVVDVAASAGELLRKYPDRQKYLVVRGLLRVSPDLSGSQTPKASYRFSGHVTQILSSTIHVPLPHSTLLADLTPKIYNTPPRYAVTLCWGKNLEPWVASVRKLP